MSGLLFVVDGIDAVALDVVRTPNRYSHAPHNPSMLTPFLPSHQPSIKINKQIKEDTQRKRCRERLCQALV